MSKKGPYTVKEIKGLSPGTQLWGKYLVNDKVQRRIRDGREIINLKIGDSSGEMDAVVWDNCPVTGELKNGTVIGLLGDVGAYNNKVQVTARRIKVIDEEDPGNYTKTPLQDREKLMGELNHFIGSMQDPYLKDLLQTVFNEEMTRIFAAAPAARRVHHYYAGGLLEHTLSVARLCEQAALVYTHLNRDLLVAGALLHDIGKVEEYKINVIPEYTLEGKMLGHIVIGFHIVEDAINQVKGQRGEFPHILALMLKHMVLSHHGTLDFGSPVKPLFPEAFLLHMMDNLDAKVFVFTEKIEENDQQENYISPYDTFHQQEYFTFRYQHLEDETDPDNG